jgi:SAM-dependent methyltransferase
MGSRNTMNDIAVSLPVKTDKMAKGRGTHGYTLVYPTYMEEFRDKPIRLLEIGINKGGSLALWNEYFSHPKKKLFAIEVQEKFIQYAPPNVTAFLGSQGDVEFLKKVGKKIKPLDFIIDDGSHQWGHQRISFENLWQFLRPGGIYIVEDIHTSYKDNPKAIARYGDEDISFVDYVHKNILKRCISPGKAKEVPFDINFVHFYKGLLIAKKNK